MRLWRLHQTGVNPSGERERGPLSSKEGQCVFWKADPPLAWIFKTVDKVTDLIRPWVSLTIQGAEVWCTGTTLRDGMRREEGGGFRMGDTCTPMADSCQCMAKTTTVL